VWLAGRAVRFPAAKTGDSARDDIRLPRERRRSSLVRVELKRRIRHPAPLPLQS